MTHYIAGMILAIAMLCRLVWAFFGNAVSRQIFIVPFWRKSWRDGFVGDIKWYLFINKKPDINMGHNPLAQAAMFLAVLCMFYMCFTGLGVYSAKGYSALSRSFHFMENLAYNLGGNGIDLVLWHRMGMIFLVAFVMIHVYMVIREEIMGRTTMISTMTNGVRMVKATLMQDWRDVRAEAEGREGQAK